MNNTKEIIIQKALILFLKEGFYNVSLKMIAAEVGISKPAIYHHFKNKDALVDGVLDHFSNRIKKWNQDFFKDLNPGKPILRKMFKAIPIYKNIEQILLTEPGEQTRYSFNELLITLSKYKPAFKQRIAHDIKGGTNKIKVNLEELELAEVADPEILALLLHAVLEGLSFLSEVREDIDLEELSEDLFELVWKLIKQ